MKSIFVSNLDTGTTAASILSLFQPHGTVDYLDLVTDRITGLSRGFAFIEMQQDAEADRAINALNGSMVDGRPIKVYQGGPQLHFSAKPTERGSRQ